MWKYVSRRLKDTVERGANYFEAKNVSDSASLHCKITSNVKPLRFYPTRCSSYCWSTLFNEGRNKTNNKKWYYEQLHNSWIGAITWSSALVLGWYASQLLCLSQRKYTVNADKPCAAIFKKLHPIRLHAPLRHVYNQPITVQLVNTPATREAFPISFVSNDVQKSGASSSASSNESVDSAADKLSDVLSAIENKLGMAAIENGDYDGGMSLLKSAAHRNHAPAMYNLGICYESGLGTTANDKMAVEYYRAAASLEHPTAMYNLAIFYGQGRGGLHKDSDTALRLLRIAAAKGQKDAISALASTETNKPSDKKENLYGNDMYADSPTGMFLQMIGAINAGGVQVSRAGGLIY